MKLMPDGKGLVEDNTRKDEPPAFDPTRWRPLVSEVLQLIWRERTISRADIARTADLSRSTVSEIVSILLPSGLIQEAGTGPSSGGRRPIGLEFQDDACSILGVDMGASHVGVALTNLHGAVVAWEETHHAVREDPEGTRRTILELAEQCLSQDPLDRPLLGVGIGVPSPVDPLNADWLSEVVLPKWKGRLGLTAIKDHFGCEVLVDNDANLGALAEHWWGAGQGVDNLAYIKIATGIGSGHVIDGEIYRGSSGKAGEIGHLAIDPHGNPCICGLRGCLATFVGAQALVSRAAGLLGNGQESALDATSLSIDTIEDAALAGDPVALQVAEEAAEYLGIAVAGLLNLINPTRVIVGGDLARLGDLLLTPLRETTRMRTLVTSMDAAEISVGVLGSKSVAVGAATLVLKAALQDWSRFPTPALREVS